MTMQHELFVHPNRRVRTAYPLVVVLQADVAEGDTRVVAPLSRATTDRPSRMRPLIRHDTEVFMVIIRLLAIVPVRLLRHPVGSIAQHRDDLARALDWLLFGI
jgi:hypothetical protein